MRRRGCQSNVGTGMPFCIATLPAGRSSIDSVGASVPGSIVGAHAGRPLATRMMAASARLAASARRGTRMAPIMAPSSGILARDMRVVVVGSINADFVVTADRLPEPGETVLGGRFSQHHGGKGANQAVAAARAR